MYTQLDSENDNQYKKRIYTRRSEESDEEYVTRINILRSLFIDSNVWIEDIWLTYSADYYDLIATQENGETTEHFYSRLTEYLPGENDDSYVRRLSYLKKRYSSLSLWYDSTYSKLVRRYYQIRYSKQIDETDHDYYVRLLQQDEDESNENYVKRITLVREIFQSLEIWFSVEEIEITRSYYMALYRKFLGENSLTYYNRIMYQGLYETPEDYVERISYIHALLPDLDLWTEPKYLIYTAKYYRQLYRKLPEENVYDYYSRLFQHDTQESTKDYMARINIISILFPNLKFIFNNVKYLNYTHDYYEQLYGQNEGESDETYKVRVFKQKAKEGNVEFVNKLTLLKAMYPELEIWTNVEEVRFTKRYYLEIYKRDVGESVDAYYRRLMYQGFYESDDNYEKRIQVIQAVLKNLDLWTNVKYLPYTAKYYKYHYRQKEGEDEETFLSKIFTRKSSETKDEFVKRIFILRQVFNSELESVLDNEDMLNYTKQYYKIMYSQQRGESLTDYATRVFTQGSDESDSEYLNRVKVVLALFPNVEFWNNEHYLDTTRPFYEMYYEMSDEESEDEYYERILTRKDGESDHAYYERIAFFQVVKPDLLCWDEDTRYYSYAEEFLELQSSMQTSE